MSISSSRGLLFTGGGDGAEEEEDDDAALGGARTTPGNRVSLGSVSNETICGITMIDVSVMCDDLLDDRRSLDWLQFGRRLTLRRWRW